MITVSKIYHENSRELRRQNESLLVDKLDEWFKLKGYRTAREVRRGFIRVDLELIKNKEFIGVEVKDTSIWFHLLVGLGQCMVLLNYDYSKVIYALPFNRIPKKYLNEIQRIRLPRRVEIMDISFLASKQIRSKVGKPY